VAFRSFRTDRMISARVLPEKFPARRMALLKQWQAQVPRFEGVSDVDVFA
jgi:predicted DNA-binding transcriptional regulator YafY